METATAVAVPQQSIARFAAIVGADQCISEPDQLLTYECDALTSFHARPGLVVLPGSTAEVVEVVKLARELAMPIVPRGSGTGLSGGALPVPGCIVLGLSRMKRILEVDLDNQFVRVEPGVINLEITKRIAPHGLDLLLVVREPRVVVGERANVGPRADRLAEEAARIGSEPTPLRAALARQRTTVPEEPRRALRQLSSQSERIA